MLSNKKIFDIPLDTYVKEYNKLVELHSTEFTVKNISKLNDRDKLITIVYTFCGLINENKIRPKKEKNSDVLIFKHKDFTELKKLTLPLLKKDFSVLNNKFKIKDYDKITTELKGVQLKNKIIALMNEYIKKGLVVYEGEVNNKPIQVEKPEVLILQNKNFSDYKKLKADFFMINYKFKIKDYDKITKELGINELKEKMIEIINDYVKQGLVKYEDDSFSTSISTPTKKTPKKRPLTPLSEREEKIVINVQKADADYKNKIRKELAMLDSKEYNLEQLRKDINDDDFIKKAIDAHIKALEFKYKSYNKLSKIDWQGVGKENTDPFSKGEVNLNELLKKMQKTVIEKISQMKSNPNIITEKRKDLLNIIDDADNGIDSVKGKSRETLRIALVKIVYMFVEVPIFFFKGFNNFVLTGPAGSGKTKVAGVIANLMKNLGILVTTNVIMATKQNLVGQYLGQSGPKTRNLLTNGLEGVVFIDEAYTLTPCDKNDTKTDNYSNEVIGELINFMDKFMGCIIIIVAGYKDKMTECFLTYNEGIARRFPKMIELAPYNSNDLYNIFELFLNDTIDVRELFTTEQRKYIKSIIASLNDNKVFTNQAGDMLNLSKVIGEDAILNNKKYDKKLIKISFQKFCLAKDIAIEFDD
jgi:hypothetical protein